MDAKVSICSVSAENTAPRRNCLIVDYTTLSLSPSDLDHEWIYLDHLGHMKCPENKLAAIEVAELAKKRKRKKQEFTWP